MVVENDKYEGYADYMARRLKEEYPVDMFNNKAQKHEVEQTEDTAIPKTKTPTGGLAAAVAAAKKSTEE